MTLTIIIGILLLIVIGIMQYKNKYPFDVNNEDMIDKELVEEGKIKQLYIDYIRMSPFEENTLDYIFKRLSKRERTDKNKKC